MRRLELALLGPFKGFLDGQPIAAAFNSNKARALLFYLAAEAEGAQRRAALAALLWPDWPQKSAMSNLRYALLDLRRNIGDRQAQPPFLHITRDALQFNRESDARVDILEFERLSALGLAHSSEPGPGAIGNLKSAVDLYRGEFLEGFSLADSAPFEEWLAARRERAKRQMLQALRGLAEHHTGRREYNLALLYAYRQLEIEPWLEEGHQQVMRLLAMSGQRGAALAQYETCCSLLAKELGVKPGVETVRLYEAIRDETLESRQAIERGRALGLLQTEPPASPPSDAPEPRPGRPLPTGTVTFLFTDIQGSTPLWEQQPEMMAEALQIHHVTLRQAIEAHGGTVFKTVGDAFQAAFSTAPQALRAAIAGQQALQAAPWNELGPLKVRMGLHTGDAEVDSGGDEYAVSHTKNRAARIISAAHGEQVLLSAETAELVKSQLPSGVSLKDLGEHHLKGLLQPEQLFQTLAPGLPERFPPLLSETRPSHNLPLALTSFIGRQRETAQVQALLRSHRLVTLTGSGGVGKTRLSIQAAGGILGEFPNGVWYVELAPLADPDLVPQAVASTLGLREEANRPFIDNLAAFLSKRELLLVLDNCEHLLDACARLADVLLRKAPRLKILASSREALGISGEHPFHVPSLATPDPRQKPSPELLLEFEAVQLFTERARAVLPEFQVNQHNAPAVAQICQRLDGIPLALELAASRLNLLTTDQLAGRLDQAFRLLTGGSRTALPRQQRLRATIDWSYQLLSEEEKILLRRLAVFAGGCTLGAAESVCAGGGLEVENILDLLGGLVNKSMVDAERQQGVESRYRLLETVRQYAREKFVDSGESERLRGRHLDYYEALCQEAYPHIHGAGRLEWTRRLQREYDNIREALEWAFQDATLALKGLHIATTLSLRYWNSSGLYREGLFWLNAGLQAAGNEIPSLLKADVLFCITNFLPGDRRPAFEECIALCREIGPEANRVLCRALRYGYYVFDYQETLAHEEEAVQLARGMGPAGSWELGEALFFYSLTLSLHPEGAYDDQALAAAQESLQVHQAGDRWDVPAYWTIGNIQALRGRDEQARQALETALEVFSESNDFVGLTFSSFILALIHRLAGRYQLAQQSCQRLFQTVDAVANEGFYYLYVYSSGMLLVSWLNDPLSSWDARLSLDAVRLIASSRDFHDVPWYIRFKFNDIRQVESLRSRMGEEVFQQAWQEGKALTLEQAVTLAREVLRRNFDT